MDNNQQQSDNERYIVHSQKEIIQILTDLAENRVLLNVTFNHGKDSFFTTVVGVDEKTHAVHLDIGRDEAFNQRLGDSHHVVFSKDDGIKIRWSSNHISAVTLKDGKAIKVALPHNLLRVQRREFFRLTTPSINPVPCKIPEFHDSDVEFDQIEPDLTLYDAGLSGIGSYAPEPLNSLLTNEAKFEGCRIYFPDVGMTSVTLQVKHITPIPQKDGSVKQRVGFEYIEPSRGNQGLIHRYTFNLERDFMAVAGKP